MIMHHKNNLFYRHCHLHIIFGIQTSLKQFFFIITVNSYVTKYLVFITVISYVTKYFVFHQCDSHITIYLFLSSLWFSMSPNNLLCNYCDFGHPHFFPSLWLIHHQIKKQKCDTTKPHSFYRCHPHTKQHPPFFLY